MAAERARKTAKAAKAAKTPGQVEAAKARRVAGRAACDAAEREKHERARKFADVQRDIARAAIPRLEKAARRVSERRRGRSSLVHHLSGLYSEVDKLAKGKTPFPVTDRILEETNGVIRDGKTIVLGDIYSTA